jgi:DNA-3-methyladenine glycosylase I
MTQDFRIRCPWCGTDPLYCEYHDKEWGVPSHDDRHLFEMLILEGAQAGLSWIIILRKRKNYRKAFDNFDVQKVAKYNSRKIESLLKNEGIVRNKLKIAASIQNAKMFIKVQQEFGSFDKYLWQFVKGKPIVNNLNSMRDIMPRTELSDAISKDLQKRGFKFVGSTIIYAYMQAVGLVDDHMADCFRRKKSK